MATRLTITFTRTLVQDITVDVEQVMEAIKVIRQLPSYGNSRLDSIRAWLDAWDGDEDMPTRVWDVIGDFGLLNLANAADIEIETVDERFELDEVAEAE